MSVMLSRGVYPGEASFELNPGIDPKVEVTFNHAFSIVAASIHVTQGQPLNEVITVKLTSARGKGPFIIRQETLVDATDWTWLPDGVLGFEVERGALVTLQLTNVKGNCKVDMYLGSRKL